MATKKQKLPSYKSLTMKLTGMTEQQYKREYNRFKVKTQNYNKLAGTHYQASRELYYSYIYADAPSPGLAGIMATPATRAHYAGSAEISGNTMAIRSAQTALKRVWWGLYMKSGSTYVEQQYRLFDTTPGAPDYVPPSVVNARLAYYVEQRKKAANGEAIYDAEGNIIEYKSTDVTAGSP